MEILTRAQAKIQGLTTYYTGESCKHGHVSERRTSNGACGECMRLALRGRDKSTKSDAAKKYYSSHAEERREYARRYRAENPEAVKDTQKRYRSNNPKKLSANNAKRRATKLNQTPKWSETRQIQEFYEARPEGYHVDHVIPLKGVNVCGLHVLGNLQYLEALPNLRKGNRY